ncbi:hypothetical protein [Kiloniella sp. b19]|uniref:hypothetical protein n=1 Tax=Kiloniella sp. GXU_MW_B19 TaxID=3141326 RepID=UPI0031D59581
MSRDFVILAFITLPFLLVSIWLAVQMNDSRNGFEGAAWFLVLLAVAGGWGLIVSGYSGWVLLRDGIGLKTLPYAAFLCGYLVLAGYLYYDYFSEAAPDRQSGVFSDAFVEAVSFEARLKLIERHRSELENPHVALVEQLAYVLSPHGEQGGDVSLMDEKERLALLQALVDYGLLPSPVVLNIMAVSNADPEAAKLLIAKRREMQGWEGEDVFPSVRKRLAHADLAQLVPQYSFDLALNNTPYCDEEPDEAGLRSLTVAQHLWNEGRNELAPLSEEQQDRLFRQGCKP